MMNMMKIVGVNRPLNIPSMRNLSLFVIPNKFDASNFIHGRLPPREKVTNLLPSVICFDKIGLNKSDKTRYSGSQFYHQSTRD